MAFDWLYGPKRDELGTQIYMRSLVLEPDTVRDIARLVEEHYNEVKVRWHPVDPRMQLVGGPDTPPAEPFDLAQIAKRPDWEIRKLAIHGPLFNVDLREGHRPSITREPNQEGAAALAERIFEKLYAEGRPRIMWKPLLARGPFLLIALMVVTWIWYLIDKTPPLSLGVAGSLITLCAGAASVNLVLEHARKVAGYAGYPGHRIRTVDREELRKRRADRWANLRVALISGGAVAILSAILIGFFKLY
ncbi:hypothetical protein [Kribbella sp. NPDC006257]|uniref:hypothetical protein n=1 Tax=Kribbella sp. NPDC006257 TaxID=3156738 RepID=UPI0033A8438F